MYELAMTKMVDLDTDEELDGQNIERHETLAF
jgi:hypothetical protein